MPAELPTRILLTGFMGSGKSSVGRELATLLGYRLIDTDAMVEGRSGMSIPQIWREHGEKHFRELELECCRELEGEKYIVIASGGGTVLDEERRELLARDSFVINLVADMETLVSRIEEGDRRPLMFTQDIAGRINELMAEREPVYRRADFRLDTSYRTPRFSALQLAWQFGEPRVVDIEGQSLSPVHIIPGLLRNPKRLDALLPPAPRVFVLTDDNVQPLHGEALCDSLAMADREVRWISLPAGEGSKSLATLEAVLKFLADNRANRDSILLGLGGGVMTDLAGLAASIYMRGIRCIILPTSLMGMVDAAIGGKTAINFGKAKNLVGSFHLPLCVACDPEALSTLPEREVRCGLAEVVKYDMLSGLVDGDLSAGYSAASRRDVAALTGLVERCSLQKCNVVSSDFREEGERKLLNFGHTIGHALESLAAGTLTHGEAVGLGMLCACRIAEAIGMAQADNESIVRRALEQCRLPVTTELPEPSAILSLVKLDKKNRSGAVEMVLPVRPGELMHGIPVDSDEITESLEAIRP